MFPRIALTPLVVGLLALGVSARQQLPANHPDHMEHRFDDPERYAQQFDDPARDQWPGLS